MALEQITMPQLGETVSEGTIGLWLKKEGDLVRRDESLVEIVSDKITTELPSPVGGRLVRILVLSDETVRVGVPIAEIETEVTASATATPSTAAPAATASNGSSSVASEQSIGVMDRVSPLARKLAAEYHVDLASVKGTGENGRIRKEDILAFVAQRDKQDIPASNAVAAPDAPALQPSNGRTVPAAQPAPPAMPTPPSTHAVVVPGQDDQFIVPTPIRRAIAEHMVRSKATSPHATTVVEVDMTVIARWLERNKDLFKQQHGYSITYLPFITRAVCEALRDVPTMNASWQEDGRIKVFGRINLGFAVSTDNGLFVPVLHDADTKSVAQIAQGLSDLAARARANRLTNDDMHGATFVITNPGVFGTLFSIPIINQPNAGILSTDAVVKRPVVIEGDAIAVRSMMYLSLSFDHRVNDGLEAARFLQAVKRRLEAVGDTLSML